MKIIFVTFKFRFLSFVDHRRSEKYFSCFLFFCVCCEEKVFDESSEAETATDEEISYNFSGGFAREISTQFKRTRFLSQFEINSVTGKFPSLLIVSKFAADFFGMTLVSYDVSCLHTLRCRQIFWSAFCIIFVTSLVIMTVTGVTSLKNSNWKKPMKVAKLRSWMSKIFNHNLFITFHKPNIPRKKSEIVTCEKKISILYLIEKFPPSVLHVWTVFREELRFIVFTNDLLPCWSVTYS